MNTITHRLNCSEIWGGNQEIDTDIRSQSITASVYSSAVDGGRGGDIYYFSQCSNDMLTRIAVADVTGHGAVVSDISRWMYDSLSHHMNGLDGPRILEELNKLAKSRVREAVTTAIVMTFNKSACKMFFSYAGHPPLLTLKKDQTTWQEAPIRAPSAGGNIPLGVLDHPPFDQESVRLEAGDRFFLYTDGVVEAPNARGDMFGREGLLSVLNRTGAHPPSKIKTAVLEALREHTGGPLQFDDVTLLAIEIH